MSQEVEMRYDHGRERGLYHRDDDQRRYGREPDDHGRGSHRRRDWDVRDDDEAYGRSRDQFGQGNYYPGDDARRYGEGRRRDDARDYGGYGGGAEFGDDHGRSHFTGGGDRDNRWYGQPEHGRGGGRYEDDHFPRQGRRDDRHPQHWDTDADDWIEQDRAWRGGQEMSRSNRGAMGQNYGRGGYGDWGRGGSADEARSGYDDERREERWRRERARHGWGAGRY